jgi:protein-tyrosine-phosphatase
MNIVFVCTGNTCRSVLAEGFMKALAAGGSVEVSSCGTGASPFFRVPLVVLGLLQREGVDLSGHSSTQIDADIVSGADYIFAMEKMHVDYITGRYPGAKGKTHLLRRFAGMNGGPEIQDPIGQPDEVYLKSALEIKECVTRVYEKVVKGSVK